MMPFAHAPTHKTLNDKGSIDIDVSFLGDSKPRTQEIPTVLQNVRNSMFQMKLGLPCPPTRIPLKFHLSETLPVPHEGSTRNNRMNKLHYSLQKKQWERVVFPSTKVQPLCGYIFIHICIITHIYSLFYYHPSIMYTLLCTYFILYIYVYIYIHYIYIYVYIYIHHIYV